MEYKEKLRNILRLKNYPTKYNSKKTISKTKTKSLKSTPSKTKKKGTMTQEGNKKLTKDIDDGCVMELAKCECQRPGNSNDPLTSEVFLKKKTFNDDKQQRQPQSISPTKNSIIWQLKDEVPVVFTGARPNEQNNKNYVEIADARLQQQPQYGQQQPQFPQQQPQCGQPQFPQQQPQCGQPQFPQQQPQCGQPQDPRFAYPPIIQTPNAQEKCKRSSGEGRDIFDDEDRVFALMLIPFLRKFSDAQKDFAKIEILQIIQKTHNMPCGNLPKSVEKKTNKDSVSNASSTDLNKKGKDKQKKKSKNPSKTGSDVKLDKKEKSTTKKKSVK